jgi:hypothetical protein
MRSSGLPLLFVPATSALRHEHLISPAAFSLCADLRGGSAELQNSRKHGLNSTNGVFGRHGIRLLLGATLSIVHGGDDQVRDDLKVQSQRQREEARVFVLDSPPSSVGLRCSLGKITVSLGGVELEDAVGVLSVCPSSQYWS